LPILRLILGIFGLFKIHGDPKPIFYTLYVKFQLLITYSMPAEASNI
jgi:hypothetical protein